jgi:hypothetical protein
MSRLLNYLPWYERESEVFKEILRAEEIEFDKLELDLEDINKQFFVDTATWGLAIYEKELGLPIRPNKSLEERRSIIKAKWRGMGKVDAEMIKSIVSLFTDTPVEIKFDGQINIVFEGFGNTQISNKNMLNAIEEVKPAHLGKRFTVNHKENHNINFGITNRQLKINSYYPYSLEDTKIINPLNIGISSRRAKTSNYSINIMEDTKVNSEIYFTGICKRLKEVKMEVK